VPAGNEVADRLLEHGGQAIRKFRAQPGQGGAALILGRPREDDLQVAVQDVVRSGRLLGGFRAFRFGPHDRGGARVRARAAAAPIGVPTCIERERQDADLARGKGPSSLVRSSVRIPKLARASANSKVMPLSNSPSGRASRRCAARFYFGSLANELALELGRLGAVWLRVDKKPEFPIASRRANAQREAGTTRRMAVIIGWPIDSGTASTKTRGTIAAALSRFFTMVSLASPCYAGFGSLWMT